MKHVKRMLYWCLKVTEKLAKVVTTQHASMQMQIYMHEMREH